MKMSASKKVVAQAGEKIVVIRNSHAGKTGKVTKSGTAKCTVAFDNGESNKFVFHGDYRIVTDMKTKEEENSARWDYEKTKRASIFDKIGDGNETNTTTLIRESVKHDVLNVATKIAAVTKDQNEVKDTINQIARSLELLTLDLINTRERKSNKINNSD